jgi:hypothetical protein
LGHIRIGSGGMNGLRLLCNFPPMSWLLSLNVKIIYYLD